MLYFYVWQRTDITYIDNVYLRRERRHLTDKRTRTRTTFTSETAKAAAKLSPMHKPGWKTKATTLRENAELIAASKGITPLEVLQGYAADEKASAELRITAATAAARYVHKPMPQAVEHSGTVRLRHTFAEAVLGDDEDGTPS